MPLSLTPSKRQHSHDSKELNAKKVIKTSSINSPKESKQNTSGGHVFRVLCPSSRIEIIGGQVDNIISQIRQETGAMVRIDCTIPGCDERIIYIMGPDREVSTSSEQSNNDGGDSESAKKQVISDDFNDKDNVNDNNTEQESLSNAGGAQSGKKSSSVQRALLLVLEKFLQGEIQTEVVNSESNGFTTVTFRLLVLSSQVGCVLGRGGSIIKQMSTESGAQIRVLPRDKVSQCAFLTDDIVQITGVRDAVKKAINIVSNRIIENANGDYNVLLSTSSEAAFHSHGHPVSRSESQSTRPFPFRGTPFDSGFREHADHRLNVPPFSPKFHENVMPSQVDASGIVTFQLLCPEGRVGGIIGKGGAIIKTLMRETGCDIKVLEGVSVGEDRVVVISGPAHPGDKLSAVQDATLHILNRIAKTVPHIKEKGMTIKFLVPSRQIGCLLGRGGAIIAEIQEVTGAFIRILGKDQLPRSASEDEEVIQIDGLLQVVQEAVLQITTRLQHHLFGDMFRSAFTDRASPFASYMGRGEPSPRFGPSLRNLDSVGALSFHGGLHPHDDHPLFMRERPWRLQPSIEGGPTMGLLDYEGPRHRQISGFRGRSQQAVITNTVFEVVVPSSLIPSIYGEDGGCLRQIRQISDAQIVIDESRPGAPETLIIISGTPEQTHAAQSLIQAFVMLESESSC